MEVITRYCPVVFRLYPPGGFVNFINQNYQPAPQQHGENFHLVGQNMSFHPLSTPSPQATTEDTTNNIVNIDEDEADNSGANKATKMNQKRYWTHEEEERLVKPLFSLIFCRSLISFAVG